MAHTFVPWQVGRVHKGFDGPFDWGIFNHEEDLIATVWGSGECEKAAAHLIAAAPEMLEVLEDLIDILEEAARSEMDDDGMVSTALSNVRDAIRKARGEA